MHLQCTPSDGDRNGSMQEPSSSRTALADAQQEIEELSRQAADTEELQQRMAAQAQMVLRLQQDLASSLEAGADVEQEDAASARITELESTLAAMQAAASSSRQAQLERDEQLQRDNQAAEAAAAAAAQEQPDQQPGSSSGSAGGEDPEAAAALLVPLQLLDDELARERQRVLEVEQMQATLEREAQEAAAQAQEAAAALAKQQAEVAAMEAELTKLQQSGGNAGGKIGGWFGKGAGGRRGKKGGNSNDALLAQLASLRQAVEQSKVELEELQKTSAERQQTEAAGNAALEQLGANFKEQAVRLYTVTAEVSKLQAQLQEATAKQELQMAALAVRKQEAEEAAARRAERVATQRDELLVRMIAQQAAQKAIKEDADRCRVESEQLQLKVAALKTESASLRSAAATADAEAARLRQALEASAQDPLQVLEQQLKDVSEGMDEVYGLRNDLQVLADAFQLKEAEAAKLRVVAQALDEQQLAASREAEEARAHEAEVQAQLQAVLQQVTKLKETAAELQASNNRLSLQNQELQGCIRAADRVTRTVESKTAEMEASLVGFADKVVSLKGQLEIKTKALAEASERLATAQEAEGRTVAAAEALAEQVEVQRKSNLVKAGEVDMLSKELQFSRAEVAKLREAELSLKATSAAITQGEADARQIRQLAQGAEAEMQQLQAQLDRSVAEVAARQQERQAFEEARMVELTVALAITDALSAELGQLQDEIARSQELVRQKGELIEALANVEQLLVAVAAKGAQLAETVEQKERAKQGLDTLTSQATDLAAELQVSRDDVAERAGQALVAAQATAAAQDAVSRMREEMVQEALRARELLAQAEQLLLTSPAEAAQGTANGVPASSPVSAAVAAAQQQQREAEAQRRRVAQLEAEAEALQAEIQQLRQKLAAQRPPATPRDVVVAESRAAAAAAEAQALSERVRQLEELARSKEAQLHEMAQIAQAPSVAQQIQSLTQKVEALRAENAELTQQTRKQEQKLKQTRQFLNVKGAAGPETDASA